MDRAVPEELGVRQTGDHSKDALLLGNAHPRLAADEVPHAPCAILHAQLDDGVRLASRSRIAEPHRLHGTKPQRVTPATRHLLDRHTPLKVWHLVERMSLMLVGRR